jgi:TolB-like protein
LVIGAGGATAAVPTRRYGRAAWFGAICFVLAVAFVTFRGLFVTPPAASIVVLPLRPIGATAETQQFADGIADGVTRNLSKVHGLTVSSSLTASRYRGTTKTGPEIAAELGVNYLLTGTVESEGSTAVVNMELLSARTERSLWSDRFRQNFSSRIDLEADVAEDVAQELGQKLSSAERAQLSAPPTRNGSAYNLYVRGRTLLYGQVDAHRRNEEAISLFEQALRLDPGFGLAFAGLARG